MALSASQPFGHLLSAHRAAARLTQEELAARAGLSTHAIGLLERGARRSPRASTVALLARALGLGRAECEAFIAAARRKRCASLPALAVPPDLRAAETPLVGRERELAQARALLSRPDVRLLTLTGPPGGGKTRLALELARELLEEYRDGAVVVTLGLLGDSRMVLPALGRALGLAEAGEEASLDTLARHCEVLNRLLVLDNFEHLLAAAPDLLELLARCPGLQALVTSRAALRVRAEYELRVPPLELPGADQNCSGDPEALQQVTSVRLFLERVGAAEPGFRLTTENAESVAAICRRLDGLPMALELAAPWLRLLTPSELLKRLDRRLELLVDGPRDLPERQQSLRAALNWSCDLLDEGPRSLLRRLSVFAGSAPFDALDCVCQAAGPLPGGVLRGLAVLVDHSLVQREAAAGEPRVRMLESVREHAREQLTVAGELEATADAHLEHYAELAARVRRGIRSRARASWLERLDREHDNLRAALRWAVDHKQAETGLRLTAALRPLLQRSS